MILLPTLPLRNAHVGLIYHRPLFSPDECAKIVAAAKPDRWARDDAGSEVGNGGPARGFARQALPIAQGGFPINKVVGEVSNTNANGWRFELSGFVSDDMPWLVRYDAASGDHHDWHLDVGAGLHSSRKLSFVVQLTAASDYNGGDFEFDNMELDAAAVRAQGTITIFPSYWSSRVTPVTAGTNVAMAGWIHGPSFR